MNVRRLGYAIGGGALTFVGLYILADVLQGATEGIKLPLVVAETLMVLTVAMGVRRASVCKWKAEHLFAMLFLPLSLLMMICMPIMRVPDEGAHLQKAWQISVGDWIPNAQNQGIFSQPKNLWDGLEPADTLTLFDLAEIADSQMDMEHLIPQNAPVATGFYPVHNYFAQALGMALVRCFTLNRLAILYGARLGGWVVTFLLMYYAVKRIPVGKYILIAASLSPMVLQEAISASADGITFAVVAAFFAQVLYLHDRKTRMTPAEYGVLYALTFCASTFKVFYCPFVLLLFTMDEKCFGGKKARTYSVLLLLFATLLPIVGWLFFCKETYLDAATGGETGASVIVPQIKYILTHPMAYTLTMLRTMVSNSMTYVRAMMGEVLSWFNIQTPALCNTVLLVMFILVASKDEGMVDRSECSATKMVRRMSVVAAVLSVVLICTGLYVWWTPYAHMWIYGIQGRYFLPIVLPVTLAAKCRRREGDVYKPLFAMFALDILVIGCVLMATMGG